MKILLGLVLLLSVCATPTPPAPTAEPSSSELASPTPVSGCLQPSDPAAHVYHPDRLQVIQPCITVSGRIDFERKEKDGDYHIGLALDPQYRDLVNDCNRTCLGGAEHGDLVLEPVCELPVTQADAVSACAGYQNPIVIPPVGTHVTATGAYVLDRDHGWTELHPLVALGQSE